MTNRLDRRPEARAFMVETILKLIQDGKIRIPAFQRPLRWRSSHVIDFLDSVYRGFPVGELLLSKQSAPAKVLHFGRRVIQAASVPDALFLVDGQQRITALAGTLLHPMEAPRGDIHAIWFDLEKEEFLRLTVANPSPVLIPLNVVADSIDLLNWLSAWQIRTERPDLTQRAISLGKAIREYQIPAYILEEAEERVLRLIFKRVNTSGVSMEESEVFQALHGGDERPLTLMRHRLIEMGFGTIEEKWILRCLKAVAGIDPRSNFKEEVDNAELPAGVATETEQALRRALEFLVTDAGIPHISLLPYHLPLLILARFFHLHPSPSARNRSLLVRWLWRGAVTGTHSNANHPTVATLQGAIDEDESGSVQRLLGTLREITFHRGPGANEAWNGRSAATRLAALAMFAKGPLDPEYAVPLDADRLQELLETKDLSQIFVKKGTEVNIAARFILEEPQKLDCLLNARDEVLESHFLDRQGAHALLAGESSGYLSNRARVLNSAFDDFFQQRCCWGENDRPSIDELVRQADLVEAL